MIPNAARPRGRPRSFDELEALQKATQVFWSKGYDGATIDDLVAGMGVGRPSLYAVFGDKRTLFLRVLRAYAEKKGARAAKALLSPQTLRASLASFLRHTVENATEEGAALGCLIVCVAPLVDDAEVRQFLHNAAAGAAAMVERRFRDGISAGEISSDFPVVARASQVMDLSNGLTVRARMGVARKALLRDAEEAADLVLLPPGTSHGPSRSARKAHTVRGRVRVRETTGSARACAGPRQPHAAIAGSPTRTTHPAASNALPVSPARPALAGALSHAR